MALYAGLNLPSWAIRQQIASGLDFIVQQEQLPDGSRKITQVSEIEALEGNQVVLRDVFRFEMEQRNGERTISGKFKVLGPPRSIDRFAKRGVRIDEATFQEESSKLGNTVLQDGQLFRFWEFVIYTRHRLRKAS